MGSKIKTLLLLIAASIVAVVVLSTGLGDKKNNDPQTFYRVYLDGKPIGLIRSRTALENYINKKQSELRKKYNVDKVYEPVGLQIEKEITYDKNISSEKKIYEEIKGLKPFTIQGYTYSIKGRDKIYVLDQKVFRDAAIKTIKAFVNSNDYNNFKNGTQKPIADVGKLIEDIYISEEISLKKGNISTNEQIFTNNEDLAKYLLFGTLEEQKSYAVQIGDTIEKVAFNNNLSVDEFMVANPKFTDVNNLLYPGQKVIIGLINPKFSVVVEEHTVERKVKDFKTEVRYDPKIMAGTNYQLQAGVAGEDKVTQKIKLINGKIEQVVPISVEELKPTIDRIVVRGGKVFASVGDTGYWAWPTLTPYTITSPYAFRWGKLHEAVDIAGCGYGSPIYAANNGVIYYTGYMGTAGNTIMVNHNNGYYTLYAHLSKFYVKVGQVVERGQVIGAMGQTGFATGVHLHFGLFKGIPYKGGYSLNPLSLYR